MKKTSKINEILLMVDQENLLYEEYARLISELELMQESADSIDDIETAKWFEAQKNYWNSNVAITPVV